MALLLSKAPVIDRRRRPYAVRRLLFMGVTFSAVAD